MLTVLGLLLLLVLTARGIARFYTDALWFRTLGQGAVFSRMIRVKVTLAVVFSLLAGLSLLSTAIVAERLAPFELRTGMTEQLADRYRLLMARRGRLVRGAAATLFGLMAGVPAAGLWKEWLLFSHPVSFGRSDPQFHRDVSFYVFRLPWITFMVEWLFTVSVVCTVLAIAIHYVHGGIRLSPSAPRGPSIAPSTRMHIAAMLAGLALLKAVGYYFDRFQLVNSTRGTDDGAFYTDVHAQLPALGLLLLISLLAAIVLLATIRRRDWHLPLLVVAAWVVVSLVAGVIFPAAVQRLQVKSDEPNKERPYLQRNIAATRVALGLNNVETTKVTVGAVDATQVRDDAAQLQNARLLDPHISTASFNRLAALTGDYAFSDLDVDRYKVGGKVEQVVIGARELSADGPSNNSWSNRHLAYTHGLGVAVASASRITDAGRPAFITPSGDGPSSSEALSVTRSGVYVGENMGSYAVVDTKTDEIDGKGVVAPRYNAPDGGVRLSSTLRRVAFALRFGEWNLFASGPITEQSQILYVRDVRSRLATVAPFLATDADPYPVVVGGKILWIADGYTTTNRYPYAQHADTSGLLAASGLLQGFNYVRNSVKAVVDAYDGSVSLYVVDESDPIVEAWREVFPTLFKSTADMPAGLAEHFRYPEDLFRVQSKMWGSYRLSDPRTFYERNDSWDVSRRPARKQDRQSASTATTVVPAQAQVDDPTRAKDDQRIDPYYTLLKPPGGGPAQFVLLRSFVPFSRTNNRPELVSYMTASSDPGNYGELHVYEVSGTRPSGPFDVANSLSKQFSDELTLKDAPGAGSEVVFGDLQLMPVGRGIVWVRPWFVQETTDRPIPELKTVTVTSGNASAAGTTLEGALQALFLADPGFSTVVSAGGSTSGQPGGSAGAGGTSGGGGATPSTTATTATTVSPEALLAAAGRAKADAAAALKAGDLGTYQRKIDEAYSLAAQAASKALGVPVTAGPGVGAGSVTGGSVTGGSGGGSSSSSSSTTVPTSTTVKPGSVQGPTTSSDSTAPTTINA